MLLSIDDLRVRFRLGRGERASWVEAVGRGAQGVSFEVPENGTVALVGESGSGKSVTAMSVLDLLPANAERRGAIRFDGRDLLAASTAELQRLRGRDIACVFQEPQTSLNPVLAIGAQIVEPVRRHLRLGRRAARRRAEELLAEVGLPEPRRRLAAFPHELSGGQQQRVMIAIALACQPRLLIADEPTTALDVTTQAQILALMEKLQQEFGSAIVMITHDLGVVAEIADDVLVMYAAEIVERGTVDEIFKRPQHPYSWGLLGSLPRLDTDVERLVQIQGQPPSLLNPPRGCRFHPRCPYVMDICKAESPPLADVPGETAHRAACHLDQETKDREAAKLLAGMMGTAA